MSQVKGPRVHRSPVRCPYCHDPVNDASGAWVACSGCLARHHADCWMGQSGCASCLHEQALLPVAALLGARERLRTRRPRAGRAIAFGLALVALQVGVAGIALALQGGAGLWAATPAAIVQDANSIGVAPVEPPADPFARARADLREARDALIRRQGEAQRLAADYEQTRVALWAAKGRADLATSRATHLSEHAAAMTAEIEGLRRLLAAERQQVRQLMALLARHEDAGVRTSVLLPGPPVPAIHGIVLASGLAGDPEAVVLSVGWDHQVEQGFRFSVYRGSTFVGKVVVEAVHPGVSFARVLFLANGESIDAGDPVATRLQ